MEQVVAVERAVARERVDQVQPLRRAVRHRHRDRLVQRHHRAGLDAAELGVEQRDLAPVGRAGPRRLRVDRGDRRLERVRARRPPQRERAVDERQRLADHRAVPALAILLLEQHEVAVRADPRLAPRVVEEHQREQPGRLRLVGQQQVDDPGEPDRLRREVLAHDRVARGRGVALVEDQVEHREHGGEPVRERVGRRLGERDARHADLVLRAHQPLRHGRLGEQQRAGDLGHGQAADQPQRQRDLGLERQRRVAAGEDEAEPLVGDHRLVLAGQVAHRVLELAREQRLLVAQRRLAPQPVDRAALGRGEDPRGRGGRHAVARPAVQRDGVRVLHGLLGAVDVPAERAREDRHRAAELGPERPCDRVGRGAAAGTGQPCSNSWIGRSSTLP